MIKYLVDQIFFNYEQEIDHFQDQQIEEICHFLIQQVDGEPDYDEISLKK
jgi:hypothetical protein